MNSDSRPLPNPSHILHLCQQAREKMSALGLAPRTSDFPEGLVAGQGVSSRHAFVYARLFEIHTHFAQALCAWSPPAWTPSSRWARFRAWCLRRKHAEQMHQHAQGRAQVVAQLLAVVSLLSHATQQAYQLAQAERHTDHLPSLEAIQEGLRRVRQRLDRLSRRWSGLIF